MAHLIKSAYTEHTSNKWHSWLERGLQSALDSQWYREMTNNSTRNEDQLQNDNKNQGLMHTIVNYNRNKALRE